VKVYTKLILHENKRKVAERPASSTQINEKLVCEEAECLSCKPTLDWLKFLKLLIGLRGISNERIKNVA
jgi:hypothetical protein